MIMPYCRKATQADLKLGPAEIDFNALWDRGYVPIIKELDYEPVRADQDTGALIVGQILERLCAAQDRGRHCVAPRRAIADTPIDPRLP
jgi:hypothetical protein